MDKENLLVPKFGNVHYVRKFIVRPTAFDSLYLELTKDKLMVLSAFFIFDNILFIVYISKS